MLATMLPGTLCDTNWALLTLPTATWKFALCAPNHCTFWRSLFVGWLRSSIREQVLEVEAGR